MSYAPIAGNAAFSRVRDMAGQVATVNAAEVKAASVSATKVSSALPALAPSFAAAPYGKTLVELELRTPTTWDGLVGVVALTTNGTTQYQVPAGGIKLVSALLVGASDLSAAGATLLNLGSAATVVTSNTILASADGDEIEFGGGVSVGKATTTLAFGSTGSAAGLSLTATHYITLETTGAAFSAVGGGARLRLVYYV
jgi:hypothetical protein